VISKNWVHSRLQRRATIPLILHNPPNRPVLYRLDSSILLCPVAKPLAIGSLNKKHVGSFSGRGKSPGTPSESPDMDVKIRDAS
jgi:hypothetical protein